MGARGRKVADYKGKATNLAPEEEEPIVVDLSIGKYGRKGYNILRLIVSCELLLPPDVLMYLDRNSLPEYIGLPPFNSQQYSNSRI